MIWTKNLDNILSKIIEINAYFPCSVNGTLAVNLGSIMPIWMGSLLLKYRFGGGYTLVVLYKFSRCKVVEPNKKLEQ